MIRARRIRIPIAAGAALLLGAAFAWLILTDAYPDEGPWVTITPTHGVHVGDLMLVSIWALVVVVLARWALGGTRAPTPPHDDPS